MVKEIQIDVESKQLALMKKILKRHIAYKTVWAYGSRVNWTANQYSDLDLVVFDASTVKLGELKEDFAECDLPFSVDVMSWEKIPEKFRNKILKKYVVLQKKPALQGWNEYRLEDLGQLQRGRSRHRPRYAFHLYGGKYPFIQTGEIREARKYIIKYEQTYNEEGLKQSKLWSKGTLCITIAANIAELAILSFDACFPDSVLGFIPNEQLADLDYIFYTLTHFQRELKHIGEGSVQDNINLGTFQNIQFLIPPLPEQKAIASVLSDLDDKIDLLHRQNKTLEDMAEALFRQWFVEEAQEDWIDGQLGDVLELIYGKGLKEEIRTGKGYPVVGSSGVVGYHSDFLVDGPGIVIGRKGTLGKVIYIFENFFPIDTTYYIKSKVNSTGLFYEYFLLKSLNFEDMNSDSAVPGLNRDIALSTEIKIAPFDKLKEFNQYSSAFLEKINSNNIQTRILEKLRDTLLPRLMCGEVRVEYNKARM